MTHTRNIRTSMLLTRREWLLGTSASAAFPVTALSASSATWQRDIRAIETRVGGRIGVFARDLDSGATLAHREDERFSMASTFKWILAAQVLSLVDDGRLQLEQRVPYHPEQLLFHSPVTAARAAEGALSVLDLCAAIVEVSDNTAANLLLQLTGGPAAVTAFIRAQHDSITRLDRIEPDLNDNLVADPRDTTSPRAMVGLMRQILLGNVLRPASRSAITQWLVQSSTGLDRLRAGVPVSWRSGDKTGTGARGAVNDLLIAWPPKRKPVLLAVYLSDSTQSTETLVEAHAGISRLVLSTWNLLPTS